MRSHIGFALALLFVTGNVTWAETREEFEARIAHVLSRSLKPRDLGLRAHHLSLVLRVIGARRNLFTGDHGFEIAKVGRANREWVALVYTSGDNDDVVPCHGFYLDGRGKRVSVQALPTCQEEPLDGPMDAAWRRRGRYLIGTGMFVAFHSMKFAECGIQVFSASPGRFKVIQNVTLPYVKETSEFRSATNDDIRCKDEGGHYQTMEGSWIWGSATGESIWSFRHGRYHKIRTFTVHDELWAGDQLVTAVARGDGRAIARFVPNASRRRRLVTTIRENLRERHLRISSGDRHIVFLGDTDVEMIMRRGRWQVGRFDFDPEAK